MVAEKYGSGIPYLAGAGIIVVVDYLTKLWAVSALDGWGSQAVLPGVNLVLVRNSGAAFGFLANAGGWQTFVFIGIGIVICLALIGWLVTKRREVALDIGLALILGGAAGNIIDRFRQGSVIDFIDLHLGHWHWPAFNVADIAISAGAVLLVADLLGLFSDKDRGSAE
ncbi:MAG TPA: signal peptidase II [Gammaproteobacteria bacterium]|nr:signal peptidase II [Gammaproteobacteria bacterium]